MWLSCHHYSLVNPKVYLWADGEWGVWFITQLPSPLFPNHFQGVLRIKNKGLVIITVVLVVLFIADLVTSLLNWELFGFLEANLIYRYVGLPGIIIINILIIAAIVYSYITTKSVHYRFYLMAIATCVCFVRVSVIYTNIMVYLNPPTIEQAMQITQAVKNQIAYKVYLSGLIPYLMVAVTFILYSIDHYIQKKNGDSEIIKKEEIEPKKDMDDRILDWLTNARIKVDGAKLDMMSRAIGNTIEEKKPSRFGFGLIHGIVAALIAFYLVSYAFGWYEFARIMLAVLIIVLFVLLLNYALTALQRWRLK